MHEAMPRSAVLQATQDTALVLMGGQGTQITCLWMHCVQVHGMHAHVRALVHLACECGLDTQTHGAPPSAGGRWLCCCPHQSSYRAACPETGCRTPAARTHQGQSPAAGEGRSGPAACAAARWPAPSSYACVHVCVCKCVCAHMCAFVYARVCALARVCACARASVTVHQ